MTRNALRIRNGFLTTGPTLDAFSAPHDEEREERVIATYNPMNATFQDMPADDDEEQSQGEVVARFPANGFTCQTEGDEIVIYRGSGSPPHKTDIFDMTTRDSRSRRPRTLRELNALHAAHYRHRKATR
jgi:hypothetical protein